MQIILILFILPINFFFLIGFFNLCTFNVIMKLSMFKPKIVVFLLCVLQPFVSLFFLPSLWGGGRGRGAVGALNQYFLILPLCTLLTFQLCFFILFLVLTRQFTICIFNLQKACLCTYMNSLSLHTVFPFLGKLSSQISLRFSSSLPLGHHSNVISSEKPSIILYIKLSPTSLSLLSLVP